MTLLQQLYALGDIATVGGKTISAPRLTEIADAEAECAREYLSRIKDAADKSALTPWAQETMYGRATEVLQQPIVTGSQAFNRTMFASASGIMYLGWLCMRVKHPEIKLSDAAAILSANPEALLEVEKAWGSGKNLFGPAMPS